MTLPPVWISPRKVHCRFGSAAQSFSKLISREKQSLSVISASLVEFKLLGVGTIISELIRPVSSIPLREKLQ